MPLYRAIATRGYGALPAGGGGGAIASPVLAVADLGNGTGATATITGSESGSVDNEVYVGIWSGQSGVDFVLENSRTGNGTVSLTLTTGHYWGYVLSNDGASYSVSDLVYFRVTDTSDVAVVELISREIKRRLEQVTTANGYGNTFDVVRTPARGNDDLCNNKCIVEQAAEAQKVGQIDGNPPGIEWQQDLFVTIHVAAADDDTTPVDTVANQAAADAEYAITNEQLSGDWSQFSGLAMSCEQSGRNITNDGTNRLINLTYSVLYRTSDNDPYTVR